MTATTSTSIRTASGWTLALCTTIALVAGAGVGSAATALLTDDGPTGNGPSAVVEGDAEASGAFGDVVAPDALERRLVASGATAVVAPLARSGVFAADAAGRSLAAAADERLDLCVAAVVAADAIEHCLTQP